MKEPKIRFKGFKGEWENTDLGTIAPLVGGYAFQSSHFEKTGISIVRISNILSSGIVGGDFTKYKCFEGDSPFRLYDGDTVVAMSGATTGKVAFVKTKNYLYQNQRVGKFSKTDKVVYSFVSTFVSSEKFANALNRLLTASAQPNASSKDIDSVELSIPPAKTEQQSIASFFTTIDAQISASTSRLASLKQIKAASLQAMFPQEGETVPKLRFKGFEGEWEKERLSNLLTVNSGRDYKHLSEGNIPVYGTGGYMLSVNKSLSDIDAIGIGRKGTIDKPQLLKAPFWTVDTLFYMIPKLGNDLLFLYAICEIMDWKGLDESTGVPSLSKQNIENIVLLKPATLNEQRAIASYFTTLDRQITLQSQRLEKLKQIKAACLDKMFV